MFKLASIMCFIFRNSLKKMNKHFPKILNENFNQLFAQIRYEGCSPFSLGFIVR